ncbi:hypothetical protein GCM10022220_72030 [Actinocatenispora rupis]|uniref:Short chain dehydrogenase n=1 Tax=Actinocatenispora rupis TaxID=519421 RepID=A0A8J3JGI4_9ACTN|nr:hypothetical protein Aru02nite_71880 [Actinocatenispora rupis]
MVLRCSNARLFSPVVFGDLDFRFRPYGPTLAYGQAKTAAVLLAVEISRRWRGHGIVANAGGRHRAPAVHRRPPDTG